MTANFGSNSGKPIGGGCACPSCRFTNSFADAGFDAWPKGNPAGKSAARDYAAHVAFGKRTSQREIPASLLDPKRDAVSFYGVPKGLTRAGVMATLERTFARIVPLSDELEQA